VERRGKGEKKRVGGAQTNLSLGRSHTREKARNWGHANCGKGRNRLRGDLSVRKSGEGERLRAGFKTTKEIRVRCVSDHRTTTGAKVDPKEICFG